MREDEFWGNSFSFKKAKEFSPAPFRKRKLLGGWIFILFYQWQKRSVVVTLRFCVCDGMSFCWAWYNAAPLCISDHRKCAKDQSPKLNPSAVFLRRGLGENSFF